MVKMMSVVNYQCNKCGMGVTGLRCSKCNEELKHSIVSLDDGTTVNVSQCPQCDGMIKSPQCCGIDMQNKNLSDNAS